MAAAPACASCACARVRRLGLRPAHHFGERKFLARPTDRSPGALLLRRPLVVAPFLALGLGLVYLALSPHAGTDAYLAYYFGTSMLHSLHYGWIWKVRRPEVSEPLRVRPTPA